MTIASLLPAETSSFPSPIPTQFVSSDEFLPSPQTENQKRVEARVKELGTWLAKRQGMGRRRFFKTAAGMAAAFIAMNDVYGPLFSVSAAEAAIDPSAAFSLSFIQGPDATLSAGRNTDEQCKARA